MSGLVQTAAGASLATVLTVLQSQQAVNSFTESSYSSSSDLALTDVAKMLNLSGSSAAVLTIRKNAVTAYPVGCTVAWVVTGTGQWTFTASAGDGTVTLTNRGAATKSAGQGAGGYLYQSAQDVWYLFGDTIV